MDDQTPFSKMASETMKKLQDHRVEDADDPRKSDIAASVARAAENSDLIRDNLKKQEEQVGRDVGSSMQKALKAVQERMSDG